MNKYFQRKKEVINIEFNIIVPAIIMTKFDDWFGLDPTIALLLALSFPLIYGAYDFIQARKWNIFSCIGFFSILITGGIGLLKLPSEWIPIKEAAVPMIFCVLIILSLFSKRTLLEKFLFNENLMNTKLVYSHIKTVSQKHEFQRIMRIATLMLAASFILSAFLNYILARYTIRSSTSSPSFTKELGTMLALSYPIIVLPCMVVLYGMLRYVVDRLARLSGLSVNEILDL